MPSDRLTHEMVEAERYELQARPVYSFQADRRSFMHLLGAGIVVSAHPSAVVGQRRDARRGSSPLAIEERLHIGNDGAITVFSGKVDVGQGSRTQLAQAAAEELRVEIGDVRVVLGDTERCPNDGSSAGSKTTPRTVPQVRALAAAARELLLELAASTWHTDRSSLVAADGAVVAPDGQRQSYATLVAASRDDERWHTPPTAMPDLTAVAAWRVLGTSPPPPDAVAVVTGSKLFPADVVRPNMLYGKVLRPPSYGATLEAIDLDVARSMDNVVVVRDGPFVGCAARRSWVAEDAVAALGATAQWHEVLQPDSTTLFRDLLDSASHANEEERGDAWGSVDAALAAANSVFRGRFEIPYVQHAPLEPRAAVAEWTDDALTVWTGTQNPLRVRSELARALKIKLSAVRVIAPQAGGAFGGKHTGEAALEAARLARTARRPVSIRWTREEEFTWAYFRPAGVIDVAATLDRNGALEAWSFRNYNSGGSAIETPYRVPHGRTMFVPCKSPLREGSYRALASTANNFARESMIDDLARAADSDPLAFRQQHLRDKRLRQVLEAAATAFNWRQRSRSSAAHHGVGLSCGTEKDSYVAACVEVVVESGRVHILEICQAFDCGAIQNPANLKAQVEACLLMGLGPAMFEQIEYAKGRISNASFADYRVPRFGDVPHLRTVLINRREQPSVGGGETPIIAVAPALANAICDATGKRLSRLPLKTTML